MPFNILPPIQINNKPPRIAIRVCMLICVIKEVNPIPMRATIASSMKECPVAIKGPTIQPRRGDWLTIAADTGPGDTTAPIPRRKDVTKRACREDVAI
jgi:hypothetical protein